MRVRRTTTYLFVLAVVAVAPILAGATSGRSGGSRSAWHGFTATVFASGAHLWHSTPHGREALAQPDDITALGQDVFVGFQNGVGPQGQPSPTGNRDSTVVEFNLAGRAVRQWDVQGKCDGLTADPLTQKVIATVNEDANSSLYVITPTRTGQQHFHYNRPLPSDGGTDAITIHEGVILISASAPGTTGAPAPQPAYPAVYRVTLNTSTQTATIHPLFSDEASARVANTNSSGALVRLALTDPDSNENVPSFARRFAGDFMLTSQGDKEQIFVHAAGTPDQSLSVLRLSDSVDDTAWASSQTGAILTTDNANDTIYRITGPFQRGGVYAAETPCDANNAPSTCPAPGFPPNHLDSLNPFTGRLTRLDIHGPKVEAQGVLFLPQATPRRDSRARESGRG